MNYTLPAGHTNANKLDFSRAAQPVKNPLKAVQGLLRPMGPGDPWVIMSFRCKKYGGGISGDKNARWRKGRGLSHGMRSLKLVVAKTAGKP
jgi:hypothetical protein